MLCSGGSISEPKNARASRASAMSCIVNAARLDPPKHREHFMRSDPRNRPAAQLRKDEPLELAFLALHSPRAEVLLLKRKPFSRDRLKGVYLGGLLGPTLRTRVHTFRD